MRAIRARKAWQVEAGDGVVERADGALLEVARVEIDGNFVTLHFVRAGIVPVRPRRLAAEAIVRVLPRLQPCWACGGEDPICGTCGRGVDGYGVSGLSNELLTLGTTVDEVAEGVRS